MFVLACHCLVVCSSPHAAEESFLCQQWPCSLTNKQIEKCLYLLMYKSPPQFLSCSIHIWATSLLRIEVHTIPVELKLPLDRKEGWISVALHPVDVQS